MAKLLGELNNENAGEVKVVNAFLKLNDSVSIKPNLNLLGVLEIDLLVIHPDYGNFIIEIKNHPLSSIEKVESTKFILKPNPNLSSQLVFDPVSQARKQLFSLQQYFWARDSRPPYLFISAALPAISKEEFLNKFGENEYLDNMFFREDLENEDAIERILENCTSSPFQGRRVSKNIATDSRSSKLLIDVSSGLQKSPRKRSFEESNALFQNPKRMEHRNIERVRTSKLYRITGKAGTGKTYRLLKWANFHVVEGKSVLVLTFNNALAAELRRINANTDEIGSAKGNLIIFSFSEFLKHVEHRFGISVIASDDEDLSAAMERRYRVASKLNWDVLDKYDYIAIDEGQDVQDHVWEFIDQVANPEAHWAIVWAANQNLYVPDKALRNLKIYKFMQSLEKESVFPVEMPKSFRAKTFTWIMGQLLGDHAGPVGKLTNYAKFEQEIETYLASNPLQLERNLFTEQVIGSEIVWHSGQSEREKISTELDLMMSRISQLGDDAAEMILFSKRKDWRYQFVVDYLEDKNYPYVDFVTKKPENPYLSVMPNLIRISTIHRARGIDSTNSIVFGLDQISYVDTDAEDNIFENVGKNLMYIGLTRARFKTIIFGPNENLDFVPSDYSPVYEQLLIIYKILKPKIIQSRWNNN
jgi:hypothetical protein